MFYSPKKDIERYVTLKNHQIRTLKEQIDTEKITEESLEIVRKKLEKVKLQYNILLSQNHQELIDTLKTSENNKKILEEELKLITKQLELKTNQKMDLFDMRRQVLSKVDKAKQSLTLQKQKNAKLTVQRQTLDEKVQKMVDQNQKARKENDETQQLLVNAKKQLSDCKVKLSKNQQKGEQLKDKMSQVGQEILGQKQMIGCLKAESKMQQLKTENLEMKIQYLLQVKSTLMEQKEKISWNKSLLKERSELNKHQSMSGQVMSCLVKVAAAMKENKLVEKEACEREIKDKLIELELTECTQNELVQQVEAMTEKIAKVEQNTVQITTKMKNLEVQDPDLVSMMMRQSMQPKDRKVDEKKTVLKSRQNKENVSQVEMKFNQSSWSKLSQIELAKTADDQSQICWQ